MNGKAFLVFIFVLLPSIVFANTLQERSLKGYDPYLADKDGFDSLFINPAGIASETDIFNIAMEAGTWGKLDNYKLLADNIDNLNAMVSGEDFTLETAESILPVLTPEIDDDLIQKVLKGTTYTSTGSNKDFSLENLTNPEFWSDLQVSDLEQIAENLQDQTLQKNIMEQFDSIQYNLEMEARLGTLIKGIGFGIYVNNYSLYSLGAQGIRDMLFEMGAVLGYGFELGPFSLGVSGNFSMLLADDPRMPFNIVQPLENQQVLYGYAWGLDVGAIWEPLDSWRFAVVLDNILGSVTQEEDMAIGSVDDVLSGNIGKPNSDYNFTLDMSVGMSWQPKVGAVRPKFSLDFYDFIGMTRSLKEGESYSNIERLYISSAPTFLRHMRVGANVRFLNFLDVGASYYMEYITVGLGLDIYFIELFLEARTKHNFSDVGADLMLKFKF